MKPYTYVLVREDLSIEQQMVQACHAALEAGFAFEEPSETSSLIVCTVANQEKLLEAAERLAKHGIANQLFFEPDWEMGHSALATKPLSSKSQRYLMSKYPLFKGHHHVR